MSADPEATPRPETSLNARPEGRGGIAPIKPEYLIHPTPLAESSSSAALNNLDADDIAEGHTTSSSLPGSTAVAEGEPTTKKENRHDRKKKFKGQNKARAAPVAREQGPKVCRQWSRGECSKGQQCRFRHTWEGWFETKAVDIRWKSGARGTDVSKSANEAQAGVGIVLDEEASEVEAGWKGTSLFDTPPYVRWGARTEIEGEDEITRTIDMHTACPVKADLGWCPYGFRCRFLGGHVRRIAHSIQNGREENEAGPSRWKGWEVVGEQQPEQGKWRNGETNWEQEGLLWRLKNDQYDFPFSRAYLAAVEPDKPFNLGRNVGQNGKVGQHKGKSSQVPAKRPAPAQMGEDEEGAVNQMALDNVVEGDEANEVKPDRPNGVDSETNGTHLHVNGLEEKGWVDGQGEAPDVPLRPEEKKRLQWKDELYLAPLTTVGNLPFRRLCVSYGATITCGEMALAHPLVTGHSPEFSLLRRHSSERTFGAQVAGGYANRMVPCAEMLAREFSHGADGLDFVDVNMGCPIDLVFNQGAGSALLDAPGRLGKLLLGMNRALGDIPLTVKFRTGVASGKPNAHKLIPRFAGEWGVGAMTLHGRSRQQRYSKLADWGYIKECVETLRATTEEEGGVKVPIFGNGDCFSAQQYYEEKEKSGVDGVMLARGALIKPWIFTEIAERREWDISAVERLEGIKKYVEYGLTHWGSDTQGISQTRRFLCEALSFTHRYVPIGLLERLPPQMNERPPAYRGRNELETLLSSPFAGDWVKISEMFLGKPEEGWVFVPKHKSNAYGGEEAQG